MVSKDFLSRLREANIERANNHFKHDLEYWSILEWAGAAAGECGEMANIAKKIRRHQTLNDNRFRDKDIKQLYQDLKDEIADVIIYLDLLCARENIDLEEIVKKKFNETSKETGYEEILH